jgi:hypothetical protein
MLDVFPVMSRDPSPEEFIERPSDDLAQPRLGDVVMVSNTMMDVITAHTHLEYWFKHAQMLFPSIFEQLSDRHARVTAGSSCDDPKALAIITKANGYWSSPTSYWPEMGARSFNQGYQTYLVAIGITEPICSSMQDIIADVRKSGAVKVQSDVTGMILTLREGKGGELMVNNAKVDKPITCAKNGCVLVVDRWLDPFFGFSKANSHHQVGDRTKNFCRMKDEKLLFPLVVIRIARTTCIVASCCIQGCASIHPNSASPAPSPVSHIPFGHLSTSLPHPSLLDFHHLALPANSSR